MIKNAAHGYSLSMGCYFMDIKGSIFFSKWVVMIMMAVTRGFLFIVNRLQIW